IGCPHRSHLVKPASIGPTPLSVSGAVREYSRRLLSQFLIASPRPHDPREGLSSVEGGATSGQKPTPLSDESRANSPASSTGRSGITSPETPASAASRRNACVPRAKI